MRKSSICQPSKVRRLRHVRCFCLLLLLCISSAVSAQDKRITVRFSNEKASTALNKVETLSDCKIQFNYNDVDFRVTLSATDKPAIDIVQEIIKGHGLKVNGGVKRDTSL